MATFFAAIPKAFGTKTRRITKKKTHVDISYTKSISL